ncbi:MAG TPA: TadE family protein [Bryobacteraceae bacterium]|nr:TadE family protein [Bryobacteraceae bacterium]
MRTARRRRCRGGSALEMALLMPWYLFLFVGAFDWGFYAHALISTESAARVAALYASQSAGKAGDLAHVCPIVLSELSVAPNVGSNMTTCNALPVIVTTSYLPKGGADGQDAAQVSVTYQTVGVIPIPGLLENQATFYRVVQMRLRG